MSRSDLGLKLDLGRCYHSSKDTPLAPLCHKLPWAALLQQLPRAQHQHPVHIDDGVDPMGNHEEHTRTDNIPASTPSIARYFPPSSSGTISSDISRALVLPQIMLLINR